MTKETTDNLKVLLADDEPDIVEMMAKKVADAGYATVIAYDGEDALRKIGSELPDVVLLDINMPHMSGFDVLRELRARPPQEKWIPVIIISARNELVDLRKGFEMEADHYLTKPCSMDDVLKAIKLMSALIPQHKSKHEI
jgi:DNA-binding response OmpR family regulator